MLGARFLEADFMRINLACEANDCLAYTHFLDSHKGRIGRFKRIGIAMQMETLGRACAAGGTSREAGVRGGPPGRGDFSVSNFAHDVSATTTQGSGTETSAL